MNQDAPVVDAEVVPDAHPSTELVHRDAELSVVPAASAGELVSRLDTIREAMNTAMQADVDYGVIPGTSGKPTLLKPGAEKLSALFQLDVQLDNEKLWDGSHLTIISRATVYHAPTGARLGYGEGICSTREKKYGQRRQDRTCPNCSQATIIKGKAEYGGGWLCFARKGGCGAKFDDGDQQIEGQTVGTMENPDLADTWNTVMKMAEKRARVDAVLAVTGASALFTQDVEDQDQPPPPPPAGAPPLPLGPQLPPEMGAAFGAACKALVGGDADAGRELYTRVKRSCEGYTPLGAAIAVIEVASMLAGPPSPEYHDDRGDIPDAATVEPPVEPAQEGPPSDEQIAAKRVELYEAWTRAGISATEAEKKAAAPRTWNGLVSALQVAEQAAQARESTR